MRLTNLLHILSTQKGFWIFCFPGCLILQVYLACLYLKSNLNDAFVIEVSTCIFKNKKGSSGEKLMMIKKMHDISIKNLSQFLKNDS